MNYFIDLFDVQAIDPASMNYDAVPAGCGSGGRGGQAGLR